MATPPFQTTDYFGYASAVAAWMPGRDPINIATIPLQTRPSPSTQIWVDGPYFVPGFDLNSQGGPATAVYNFPYWQYVDVIVGVCGEFAVPPVGWINAAHLNGVKILGSIFTYHCPVYLDFVQSVLATPATIAHFAQ